ncbi:MAG: MoaD/ThiS family protein [Anaerolinea sp.]|nr:MoaD/ThiS family protein [Anaerolinea sp.]
MHIELWLYGSLSTYANQNKQAGFGLLKVELPENATLADLLKSQNIPTAERGITFINGNLSALPGFQPDLQHPLQDNDRVALFDLRSMWPFQYRNGAAMIEEMRQAISDDPNQLLHHQFEEGTEGQD